MSDITLKSSDGFDLEVEEAVILESPALKYYIIENNLSDDQGIQVPINLETLTRVMDYCSYHALDRKISDEELKRRDARLVQLDHIRLFHLIHAAHELKIKSLMDLACQAYGDMITNIVGDDTSRALQLDMTESSSSRKGREGSVHGRTSELY